MEMKELIAAISLKNRTQGITIYNPASTKEIADFESEIGFPLPADFREFYLLCNGFACNEDIFNFLPLHEIAERGKNWFCFAEYMIYSDTWELRITEDGQYQIYSGDYPETTLTSSLKEFLEHFLQGNVFGDGGLYDWIKELGVK
jgi:cell wall assembly regulator SMI1